MHARYTSKHKRARCVFVYTLANHANTKNRYALTYEALEMHTFRITCQEGDSRDTLKRVYFVTRKKKKKNTVLFIAGGIMKNGKNFSNKRKSGMRVLFSRGRNRVWPR